ncbi:hypothetical protein QBC32DRAFT_354572 [Pseudoneurospora amorphoporcata]|uniref:Uncharacterized protein n=1 Tax=Pseudoneurospora amorphoporcata TaxID=241081 RepID=A0AAN6NLL7_9PEZI|nr:hypothetical protein QBC32DRAFT_354572 [Pseudoneurospora amorphoporcata]
MASSMMTTNKLLPHVQADRSSHSPADTQSTTDESYNPPKSQPPPTNPHSHRSSLHLHHPNIPLLVKLRHFRHLPLPLLLKRAHPRFTLPLQPFEISQGLLPLPFHRLFYLLIPSQNLTPKRLRPHIQSIRISNDIHLLFLSRCLMGPSGCVVYLEVGLVSGASCPAPDQTRSCSKKRKAEGTSSRGLDGATTPARASGYQKKIFPINIPYFQQIGCLFRADIWL